ncbi:hypothetical protein LTR84_002120 [Exophiala bonariae]|uniref:Xylanolytic transcriptional activator regulatory domain-containing protein n=1 Tax=Exophiala bonariae TaxID=1690606 RepID=A0AAV9NAD1_9EURO|nr:hypothetical protein LTR84_002120 [Exophiala bonariae]
MHTISHTATSDTPQGNTALSGCSDIGVDAEQSINSRTPASTTRDVEHAFEGDSSVRAHVAFAGSFARQAIEKSSLGEAGSRVNDALSALHQILTIRRPVKDDNSHDQGATGIADPRAMPMPPLDVTLQLLRELRQRLPPTFELICAVTSIEYFTEQCRKVYFATEEFTKATFIIVNVGLFFIFQGEIIEASKSGDGERVANLRSYCKICQQNIKATLQSLSLLLPARKENVIALVLGASYAVETSDPSQAWFLNSTACQLCISLGYQRDALLPGEDEHTKSIRATLFWIVYILDRALALRLGRPAVLQDYEITLNRTLQNLGEFEIHRETIQCWLAQAGVQGQIYEELYSPAALRGSTEHRSLSARGCANILQAERLKLKHRIQRLELDTTSPGGEVELALIRSDELANLSVLTLVYRALPPDLSEVTPQCSRIFAAECIETARKAIHAHLSHVRSLGTNTDLLTTYMHW